MRAWRVRTGLGLLVLGAGPAGAQTADTVPPAAVTEMTYTFRSGSVTLQGTLTLPRAGGRTPVAVLVAGSGPTDRDGNSAAGLRPNTYALLAWGLGRRGIASLRYDKRVLPSAQGPVDATAVTLDDFAGDVSAAVRALLAEERFGRAVVIGHSEGGALAIRALKHGLNVGGVVLVSTAGRTLTAVLHDQVGRQVDPVTLARFDSAWVRYLVGEDPGDLPGPLLPLFLPANRRYVRSAAAFDPVAELAGTVAPLLIVQGATDLQVGVADAEALQGARPDARLVILPETNHVLKAVADTTLGEQLVTYRDPTIPLAPRLVDEIAAWILALR